MNFLGRDEGNLEVASKLGGVPPKVRVKRKVLLKSNKNPMVFAMLRIRLGGGSKEGKGRFPPP